MMYEEIITKFWAVFAAIWRIVAGWLRVAYGIFHPYWCRQPVTQFGVYFGPEDLTKKEAVIPNGYRLHPFIPEMYDDILRLLNSSYFFTDDYRHNFDKEWLAKYAADDACFFVIVDQQNVPVGSIGVRTVIIDEIPYGYVDSLCIAREHRKRGLCETLIDLCKYSKKWERFVFRKEGSRLPISSWGVDDYYYRKTAKTFAGEMSKKMAGKIWLRGICWENSYITGVGGERFCEIVHIPREREVDLDELDSMCAKLGFSHYYVPASQIRDRDLLRAFSYSDRCHFYIFNEDMSAIRGKIENVIL